MKNYIITSSTLALISMEKKTKVIEKYVEYTLNEQLVNIIQNNCLLYGSSLKGRSDATDYLIGVKYKCPIILSESLNLFFFPTQSFLNNKCCWINYDSIIRYKKIDQNHTQIELINNKLLTLNVSSRVICNQLLKCSRLVTIIKGKK